MGRIYSASFNDVAVSAAQDLFEILSPADSAVVIHEISVSQTDTETSEQAKLAVNMVSGAPTSGSGGSTATPRPFNLGNAAAGTTVEINNTTALTGGTSVTLLTAGFNFLNGWNWLPTPEMRIVLSPSIRLVINLSDAPSEAKGMSGYVVFEELGG